MFVVTEIYVVVVEVVVVVVEVVIDAGTDDDIYLI